MSHETVFTEGSLTIARTFRTTPDRLYACWTESDHLAAWAGPVGYTNSTELLEPRPGGRHLARMLAPDGTSTRAGGIYKVADPGERLVFTHAWLGDDGSRESAETTITLTLVPTDRGTLMVFHQAGFGSEASREGHAMGWTVSFERLDVHLNSAPSGSTA
ncbi:SRPBCC family protein [Anianabacter salinae]|uniref:SRPBCC family protein n=1 Tax=Anianabacter salinae TaxID=2851023 RepID=UPI00225E079F|nr:SRPBCC domain-containing protein [Anianabacter salinae]MBV0912191.1 SRPBCC domain-containing protein [Anianabacter salinae]